MTADAPGHGVSEALARERAAVVRDLRYELAFTLPSDRESPIRGRAVLRFTLATPHRVVLDFAQPEDHVRRVRVGDQDLRPTLQDGHLIVPASATRAGANEIQIEFVAGDEALNRESDLLYTLFVPARAHLAFPCIDQPNVKGRFTLTLDVPPAWEAVANGRELERQDAGPSRRARFEETPPLPTYLFSFAAGVFSVASAARNGRTFRMLHRETDAATVARNREAIVDLHASALAWLEAYTGIPYPFTKFDVVLIPSFQFGGMEHPGAILYDAARLLLEESATQNQRLERASLIAHETAHIWFGDLVTMRWFTDVWMKEVFANFMAAKIVNPAFPALNHDLRFLLTHYPAAYQVDRTAGANPIRQPLANLSEAGQLYGPIIYQKAPIVMRQLEMMLGEDVLRDGVREYLARHAFDNASWPDLLRVLASRTPHDLTAWSRTWVEERGRPTFGVERTVTGAGGRITLTMTDPLRRDLVWSQRLLVVLGYPDGAVEVPVQMQGSTAALDMDAVRRPPSYVLPAGGGLGYGLFVLDEVSRGYLLEHVEDVPDPLTRGSAWVTLWDNMLEGGVDPSAFLRTAIRALPLEDDEQITERVLAYVVRAFWRFSPPEARAAVRDALESLLRAGIDRAGAPGAKATWLNAFRDTALSPGGLAWLERVWRGGEAIPGVTLSEADRITMVLELAVREVPGWDAMLRTQHERTRNPDRKAQLAFVMPALSADVAARRAAFERFRSPAHRRREPWVLQALQYLHHPLREGDARQFVMPALDLLRQVQQTGDIFFARRWMEATLWGHRSPEVAALVRRFLARNSDLPVRLRWIVLSAADELFRAAR